MNVRAIQPIETEYSGLTFRSKTEAVFAHALDLAGVSWVYEPTFEIDPIEGVDPWSPDFLVMWPNSWRAGSTVGNCVAEAMTIIEVKPSKPTATYVGRMQSEYMRTVAFNGGQCPDWVCLWGFWDYPHETSRPRYYSANHNGFITSGKDDRIKEKLDAVVEKIAEARTYRFDLA